jgi:hypothetical protein
MGANRAEYRKDAARYMFEKLLQCLRHQEKQNQHQHNQHNQQQQCQQEAQGPVEASSTHTFDPVDM